MMQIKNDNIIKASKGQQVKRTPVWLMRQAGRYLPEFRELRSKYDFITCCYTPDIAATLTLQPLERFDLDAVVFFSDILVIPKAMGFEFTMSPDIGPVFSNILKLDDIDKRISHESVTDKLEDIYKGIEETVRRLDGKVPLIGFAGAPFTLMAYIVHGSGEVKNKQKFETAIMWCYNHPNETHKLLDILSTHISEHLIKQVEYGASILQIFDSWASLLTPDLYKQFGIPYIKKIADKVKLHCPEVPIICFSKGANDLLKELSFLESIDVLSVDNNISLKSVKDIVGDKVAIQGNMDPLVLKCEKERIVEEVKKMISQVGNPNKGYIANLGHGCLPDFDPEKVKIFIDTIHSITQE